MMPTVVPYLRSLDNEGSPFVGAHGSGFGWWLLSFGVIVEAAFVLIGAIAGILYRRHRMVQALETDRFIYTSELVWLRE